MGRAGRALVRRSKGRIGVFLAILLAVQAPASWAARPGSQQPGATIVVQGDPGGRVRARYRELQQIIALNQRVEIRGSCMSSCTMYLVLKHNVCVTPRASLGFHGPSRYGIPLPASEFEEWSQAISAYYPAAIQTWYLNSARHSLHRMSWISGGELIRLGVQRCP